jgi:hypothetical protein
MARMTVRLIGRIRIERRDVVVAVVKGDAADRDRLAIYNHNCRPLNGTAPWSST